MNKSAGLSSAVFVAVLFIMIIASLAVGAFLGMAFKQNSQPAQTGGPVFEAMPALIGTLNSSIFLPITAHGNVKKIDGNKVTLMGGSEEFSVNLANDAEISKFVEDTANKGSYMPQEAKLSDIKTGDTADIYIKILQNGQLQGTSVIIYPPSK